jgi:16S rRNA (guanine527-N7)-methyltransferase
MENELEQFRENLCGLGLSCSEEQLQRLDEYRQAIQEWNQRVNLVSRRDVGRLVEYHFLDSAEGLRYLRTTADETILDLGSGAGLPGLVWKILRPELKIILVDSVQKRSMFLNRVVDGLGLAGVRVIRERGENLTNLPGVGGSCDVVVARTVAKLARLVEISFPLLRHGGRLLTFKGSGLEKEQIEAETVLRRYDGQVVSVESARSPQLRGKRRFVVVEKRARE